jgi:hypothetical protein
MNTPTGFQITHGLVTGINPLQAILNQSTPYETTHMLLAAYVATGFGVATVFALQVLRGKRESYYRIGFQEITHYSPDIPSWGAAPDGGPIKRVCEYTDQNIADRLVCYPVCLTHDDVCFLRLLSSFFNIPVWSTSRPQVLIHHFLDTT